MCAKVDNHSATNLPARNPSEKKEIVEKKEGWGHYFCKGVMGAVSSAAGWQASAIVGAWAPKLILDRAIAGSATWAWGALVTGPAAVKAAAPMIKLISAGAGVATTAGTAAAMVVAGKIIGAGYDAVCAKIEEHKIKEGYRTLAKGDSNLNIIAVDDWDDLMSTKDKLQDKEMKLAQENDVVQRLHLRADTTKLQSDLGVEAFRRAIAL